jgi:hypothetical protein
VITAAELDASFDPLPLALLARLLRTLALLSLKLLEAALEPVE